MSEIILSWQDLNIYTMTNLYLYGTMDTPVNYSDRLRSSEEIDNLPIDGNGKYLSVKVDMAGYMTTGPGRYAHASETKVIKDFFDPLAPLALADGRYTKNDLIRIYGYKNVDFEIRFQHFDIDSDKPDYAMRTYIYNSVGFELSDNVVFVVDGNRRYVENMAIHAFGDNFDFESKNWWTQFGNDLLLKNEVDPYDLGVRVDIEYTNKENVPTLTYDSSHFLADQIAVARENDGTLLLDALPAMRGVIADLKQSGTIKYENGDGKVIYGSNASDNIDGTSGDDIIIAGDGNDLIDGKEGNDTIESGSGNDTIFGSSGHDIINGGQKGMAKALDGFDKVDYSTLFGSTGIVVTGAVDAVNDGSKTTISFALKSGGSHSFSVGASQKNSYYKVEKISGGVSAVDSLISIEEIFGTNNTDSFTFSNLNDKFHGMGGTDTYIYNPDISSGNNVIYDDNGIIKFGSDVISGTAKQTASGSNEYKIPDTYFIIKKEGDDISIYKSGIKITTIPNYQNGSFNISLAQYTVPQKPINGIIQVISDAALKLISTIDFARGLLSPIVLDMDGDGVELLNIDNVNVFFDIDNDGFREKVGWFKSDDALLAIDLNGNGIIDNNSELFGNNDMDAYAKLALYDTNGDSVVDANDTDFSKLLLWYDYDYDGISDAGELKGLTESNILSLSYSVEKVSLWRADNYISAVSSFRFIDGTVGVSEDVHFRTDDLNTSVLDSIGDYSNVTLNSEIWYLPLQRGYGTIPDLHIAMSLDTNLLNLVKQLTQIIPNDFDQVNALVEQIMLKWAGVENIADGSRGNYVNAKHLAFLEKYTGEHFVQESYWGATPGPDASRNLEIGWNIIFNEIRDKILLQSSFAFAFGYPEYRLNDDSLQFNVSINDIISRFISKYQPEELANEVFWKILGETLVDFKDKFGLSESAIQVLVNDAMLNNIGLGAYSGYFAENNIFGSEGNDTINGTDVSDLILGFAGVDTINAGKGNDIIAGGKGNDLLTGGAGDDVYLYKQGDGNDVIEEQMVFTDYYWYRDYNDRIKFIDNTKLADLNIYARDGNLFIDILASGETIEVKYYFSYISMEVEYIEFADGSSYDIKANILQLGTESNDVIHSSRYSETINGLGGDDTIYGEAGNDKYIWGRGLGNDVIIERASGSDSYYYSDTNDRIKLSGNLTLADLDIYAQNSSLFIKIKDSGETLTIKDYFLYLNKEVEYLEFAYGSTYDLKTNIMVYGTAANDIIYGSRYSETINGLEGVDKIYGEIGDDTYIWGRGLGNDVIIERYTGSDSIYFSDFNDRIKLTGNLTLADLEIYVQNSSLLIKIKDSGEILTIKDYFLYLNKEVEYLEFSDGTTYDLKTNIMVYGTTANDLIYGSIYSETINGLAGDDTIYGEAGDDTYIWGRGLGNDVIIERYSGSDSTYYSDFNDKIKLTGNLTLADLDFYVMNTSLYIRIKDSGETLTIQDYYYYRNKEVEYIEFADGSLYDPRTDIKIYGTNQDDNIIGSRYNDVIDSFEGNDTMHGIKSDDTYIFGINYGRDVIIEEDYYSNYDLDYNDKIKLIGNLTIDDFEIYRSNSDLMFKLITTPDSLKVSGYFDAWNREVEYLEEANGTIFKFLHGNTQDNNLSGTAANEIIFGDAGNDIINGGDGRDYIDGGTGNDTLTGGLGVDHFIFGKEANSSDIITDFNPQNEVIDLTAFINQFANYNDFYTNYVTNQGSDVLISLPNAQTIIVKNISKAQLSETNFKFHLNIGPIANIDQISVNEDTVLNLDIVAQSYDIEADTISLISVGSASHGTTAIVNGKIVYTPFSNYNGSDQFTYELMDSRGNSFTHKMNVTVNPVNDAPKITGTIPNQTVREGVSKTIFIDRNLFSDIDGDKLTFSARLSDGSSLPSWIVFDAEQLSFKFDARLYDRGTKTLQIVVSDGKLATAINFNTIIEANQVPVASPDTLNTSEDTSYTFSIASLLQNDSDTESAVTFSRIVSNPTKGTITNNNDGTLTFRGSLNYNGTTSFVYEIKDNLGQTATATATVNIAPVNDAPTIQSTANPSIMEDSSYSISFAAIASFGYDVDGDILSVASYTSTQHGTLVLNSQGNGLIYTPNKDFNGDDSFDFTLKDPSGATATSTFYITVNPVNDQPVFVKTIDMPVIISGQPYSFTVDPDTIKDVDGDTVRLLASITSQNNTTSWLTLDPLTWTFSGIAPDIIDNSLSVTLYADDGSYSRYPFLMPSYGLHAKAFQVNRTINGTDGDDSIYSTISNDVIYARDGEDYISLSESNDFGIQNVKDIVYAGGGNDNIRVYKNYDAAEVYGEAGNDIIEVNYYGGVYKSENLGEYKLFGGEGNDIFYLYNSLNGVTIDGGSGSDIIYLSEIENYIYLYLYGIETTDVRKTNIIINNFDVNDPNEHINMRFLNAASTNDLTLSQDGEDTLITTSEGDSLRLTNIDKNSLTNSNFIFKIFGNSNNTTLNGSAADDFIQGSSANEILVSGGGSDYLFGGAGADQFVLTESPNTFVYFLDFAGYENNERIDLSNISGAAYDLASTYYTVIYYDSDGNQVGYSGFDGTDSFSSGIVSNNYKSIAYLMLSNGQLIFAMNTTRNFVADDFIFDNSIVVQNAIEDQVIEQGKQFNLSIRNTFLDATNDPLTITATLKNGNPLPSWLSFNQIAMVFSGVPTSQDLAKLEIKVTASDGTHQVSDVFVLDVVGPQPLVNNDSFTIFEDNSLTFSINDLLLNDQNVQGPSVNFSIVSTCANGTLTDNHDGTYTYSPFANYNGNDYFTYRVTTESGISNDATVNLIVNPVDDPLILAGSIANQSVYADSAFNLIIPTNLVTNVDNDVLTYLVTNLNGDPLPSWLNFDPISHTLSGTPHGQDIGNLDILVKVSDRISTVETSFAITINRPDGIINNGTNTNDLIDGSNWDDHLSGGLGSDLLRAGEGNDILNYSADATWGSDFYGFFIGSPNEIVFGESVFIANANLSMDIFDGGDGIDSIYLTDNNDVLLLEDAFNQDYYGGYQPRIANIEIVHAGGGNDLVDFTSMSYSYGNVTIHGDDGDDTIWGNEGNDILHGDNGDDNLDGGAGDDYLYGGDGNDTLRGRSGIDNLFGGNGADVFIFDNISDSSRNASDIIHDFEVGIDKIDVSALGVDGIYDFNSLEITHVAGDTIITASDNNTDFAIKVLGEHNLTEGDFIYW